MKRWLPAPLLSVFLLALWLLLGRSLDAAAWLLGIVLAVAVPVLSAPLRPLAVTMHRPRVALRLLAIVLYDVVGSGIAVAIGVLRNPRRPPKAAFVHMPLDLRDANGLAVLALITTLVPGTVWSELAPDRSTMLLHVFDLHDEAEFVAHYKARYERPLKEIFE
jgi:multicomponent K+:H+ antiporter subunit E